MRRLRSSDVDLDWALQGQSEQWDKEQAEVTPTCRCTARSFVPFIPSSWQGARGGFGELQKLPPSLAPQPFPTPASSFQVRILSKESVFLQGRLSSQLTPAASHPACHHPAPANDRDVSGSIASRTSPVQNLSLSDWKDARQSGFSVA